VADTYKITGYNVNTDVATVVFNLDARTDFPAVVNGTLGIGGLPKDTAANVTAYLKKYAYAYIAGKQAEAQKIAAIAPEVTALLNVVTGF
jgi:hypothetical protein